jgi:hypothetical protein
MTRPFRRSSPVRLAVFPLFAAVAAGLLGGCGKTASVDPAVLASQREKFTLAEEPDEAMTVVEVRRTMFGLPPEAAHDHEHEAAADAEHEEPGEDHSDHDHADHDHDHAAESGTEAQPLEPVHKELEVVLLGTVGGIPNPSAQSQPEFPFIRGKAMFVLADPEVVDEIGEHGHQHAPGEECAFCASHAADLSDALAVVQLKDDHGRVVSVDARELFDLKEKDAVVVKGVARISAGDTLTVDATGVYVRR